MGKKYCADCGVEITFTTKTFLKPKKEWNVEGELCKKCWVKRNNIDLEAQRMKNIEKFVGEKIEAKDKMILVSETMTDEEIRTKMYEDMVNIWRHEAGSGWLQLGTLITFGNQTERYLMYGFKTLVDQNKVIIRQNELILRALNRILEAVTPPPPEGAEES